MSTDVRVSVGDEEDPLIHRFDPESAADLEPQQFRRFRILGLVFAYRKQDKVWSIFLLAIVISFIVFTSFFIGMMIPPASRKPSRAPRNVIMMISDGFGPASQTLARNYNQAFNNLSYATQLPLDTILVGSSRTRSSSSYITDSAAGATAFACGLKSYNGAIGVDPSGKPCGTVLEAAKRRGMLTGLVVTSRITHATPAAFSAHVLGRDDETMIARQQIGDFKVGRTVDLMFGGGKCMFLPNTTEGGCRIDGQDLLTVAQTKFGWTLGNGSISDFKSKDSLPLMNLFTPDHMPYEIDRDDTILPSLAEMSARALDILNFNARKSKTGFFLMIEGSRIDMAGHSNDPAAHVHEILAYNNAVAAVKKFISENADTVLISTSDHETGGFTVGNQLGIEYPVYAWSPEVLFPVKHSGEYISRQILNLPSSFSRKVFVRDIVFKKWLGIDDGTDAEIATFLSETMTVTELDYAVGKVVSDRANLGWTTHGHTAVDVNLYATGARSSELAGNHENTEIGDFIARSLHLDLAAITAILNK